MSQSSPNPADAGPAALTVEFYRGSHDKAETDKVMWSYLNALLPKGDHGRVRVEEMLATLPAGLRNYYLTRNFDIAVADQGLAECLWLPRDENHYFPEEAALAYKALGALRQAALIDELLSEAQRQRTEAQQAETEGLDLEEDEAFWLESEEQWMTANQEFDFFESVWSDLRAHPERYTHRRGDQPA